MRKNKNIIFSVLFLSIIYLASTSITAYVQAQLNSILLDQEIQRLKAIDSIEQTDITLSFLNLIADCIKDNPNSEGTIIGCQVAVYVALSDEIEEQLGIEMEEGDSLEGKAPRIVE